MYAQLRENSGFKKSTLDKIDHLDVWFMTFKYLGFNIEKRDSANQSWSDYDISIFF